MVEKMVQVVIRVDIIDQMKKYIDRFNESGHVFYKMKPNQLITESLMEYMVNHPVEEKKVK